MLELPHTLIGAAIAVNIPNPLISLPLAFLSHFVLDLIPHWNPSLYTETKKYGRPKRSSAVLTVIDALLGLIAGLYIAFKVLPDLNQALVIVAACFVAVLPDVIEGPYFYLGFRSKILEKIILFQHNHQNRASLVPGTLTQLAAIIITLAFFL